ncbi:ABC transporter permease [Aliarcobacter cryaerophilus]|uniref:ABC transporter permease n=1 Tax=Aliarcobacter cryaerophilus TaxID=28198 RepID=UPI000ACAFF33|nr:ABC transporter permease subunit [Aliarcobacter cryaerophilus]
MIFNMRTNIKYSLFGILSLLIFWQALIVIGTSINDNYVYTQITPLKSIDALWQLLFEPKFYEHIFSSFYRIFCALFLALIIGIPIGLIYSSNEKIKMIFYLPFQILRMISPLSWMPIAVLIYDSWDGAIIFLIVMAAVWPIIFNLTQGMAKIDIGWVYVAKSFKANLFSQLRYAIIPAIAQDVITGLRLALGVSWIIIVPAEYLGVTSGLGYAINDARDTLDYSKLAALIIAIGLIGFAIDSLLQSLNNKFKWN